MQKTGWGTPTGPGAGRVRVFAFQDFSRLATFTPLEAGLALGLFVGCRARPESRPPVYYSTHDDNMKHAARAA